MYKLTYTSLYSSKYSSVDVMWLLINTHIFKYLIHANIQKPPNSFLLKN